MMKKWTRLRAAILTLTLCVVFGGLLLNCMRPMEDRAYDLSLMWAGEAMPKGWTNPAYIPEASFSNQRHDAC